MSEIEMPYKVALKASNTGWCMAIKDGFAAFAADVIHPRRRRQ